MLVGIISDTHDHLLRIKQAVDVFNAEKVEAVLHAGDFVAPFSLMPLKRLKAPIRAVFGNNDGEKKGLAEKAADLGFVIHGKYYCFELGGARFLMNHWPIAPERLRREFADREYVITGHTHALKVETLEGSRTMLINPGEACGYVENRATAGLLDLATREYQTVELK